MENKRRPVFKILRRNQVIELEEFIEKPHRRIRKLARASLDSDSVDVKDLYESLQRFGPFYDRESSLLVSRPKQATWQHVVSKSPGADSEIEDAYISAVEEINLKALNTYEEDAVKNYLDDEFIWMMIEDGCFILQVVFYLLGGSAELDYPSDHQLFGAKCNIKALSRTWTRSLFFVGNQIPQIVLMQLMNQSFFRGVIAKRKWERPSSDLFRMALYESLLLPALENQGIRTGSCYSALKGLLHRIYEYQTKDCTKKPADLLHALHLLIVGPKKGPDTYEDEDDEDDLESESGDLERDVGVTSSIRSATELKQAGIDFKKIPIREGIRGINFSTNIFRAVLELPTFVVDTDTEWMLRYLIDYEITQEFDRNRREVGSYVRFMSDLIVTPGDAKLLSKKKIIRANRDQREKLPKLLKELANNIGYSTQNVRVIRLQIEDYSRPPWEKMRHFLSLVLVLTLVQTVYTVLSYYKN
ncbi:hypothetical protein DCAR_0104017 [Daucus carota subsp. sativus]|uniref:Uncharacterized protein n=1 Tax=Daucus carota subsp. sativus TaxID=79200 RepID=A0A166IH95_DAUCS|nr:PREDICTED: uncharacterized protein LOC108203477 [Daucus carota subsp. sativus]WOG84832.1 hypothetical protein DCAR_0104017 [Daucus carota subsp. sativus]